MSAQPHKSPARALLHRKSALLKIEPLFAFYRKIEPNMDRKQDYTFKGFANFVIDREKSQPTFLLNFSPVKAAGNKSAAAPNLILSN